MTRPSLLALIVVAWTGISFGGCATGPIPDSMSLLQAMRANDARFDNLKLNYTKLTDQEIKPDPFHFRKYGIEPPKMPEDYWTPRSVKWIRSCSLVVRGDDGVISSQFEPELSEKDKYVSSSAYAKYGNVNGIFYDLSDMQLSDDDPAKNDPNYEKQLKILRLRSPLGGIYDTRMAIEFAHGIGFGERITNISSVKKSGDHLLITGQIKIWTEDISQFEIELDGALLVRKAIIRSNVNGHHTRFEILTKDTVRQKDLVLARSGSFLRTWQPTREQREGGAQPRNEQDFHVEFSSLELNLSDERYLQLTEFRIQPLMQVDDEVNNVHGTAVAQDDGSVLVE